MDNAGTRHKAQGDGDGDGNNGAGHELKRKSLLNQRRVEKGVSQGGEAGWKATLLLLRWQTGKACCRKFVLSGS